MLGLIGANNDRKGEIDALRSVIALYTMKMYVVPLLHRRRIKTEENAKVVAAVWGTEFIKFLAALDIFNQDDFEVKDE